MHEKHADSPIPKPFATTRGEKSGTSVRRLHDPMEGRCSLCEKPRQAECRAGLPLALTLAWGAYWKNRRLPIRSDTLLAGTPSADRACQSGGSSNL